MNKLYRSLLVTGIVAAGLAGCGDDVTVTEPPPPPPPPAAQIRSVAITPEVVNLSSDAVAQTVTLQAAVTADAGIGALTYAWKSTNDAVATVSGTTATGTVTVVANKAGTAGITVTVSAANGSTASGTATINVSSAANPTVSISTVTTAGGAPAALAAIAGQINVVLNLERNGAAVQSLELLMDTQTGDSIVGRQAFSGAPALGPDGAELAVEVITFPVNTAAFNATTGGVALTNRQHSMKARVNYGSLGSIKSVATPGVDFTTVNLNSFIANMSFTGTTATATSAAGLGYRRGGLTIEAIPVIYTSGGLTLAVGTVTFGSAACDASGTGTRTVSLTAPVAPAIAWTGVFPQTVSAPTPTSASVMNYEMVPGCAVLPVPGPTIAGFGELPRITGNDSNGNPIFAFVLPVAGTAPIRLDNRAPGAPTFVANPNGRRNGWINATVGLAGSNTSATDNDWLLNGLADAGVGGYVRMLRSAANTGGLVDAARAATGSSTPVLPVPALLPTSYCGIATAADLLGNESARPAAGTTCLAPATTPFFATGSTHLAFGVDIAPPTIQYCDVAPPLPAGCALGASIVATGRLNGATIGNNFRVLVIDTGSVGNSGMLAGSPQISAVERRNAAGTVFPGDCVQGDNVTDPTLCAQTAVGLVSSLPVFPVVSTAIQGLGGLANAGYYTQNSTALDAAGNATPLGARVFVYDNVVPALTSALYNVPLNGPTVVFNANSSDNLDLRDVQYSLTYGGGLVAPIQYPRVPINATFNAATLVNSNAPAGITINGFVRQIQAVTGNSPLAAAGGAFKPLGLNGIARDQAGNLSATALTAIPGASVTTGVSYLVTPAPQKVDSFAIRNAATLISDGAGPLAAVNPLSITLVARVRGPTATFAAPFTRIDFYVPFGGFLVQIGSATSFTTTDDGTTNGRRHDYSFAWTPGTAFGLGVRVVYAIGVNAVGDGLVTPVSANITITNP